MPRGPGQRAAAMLMNINESRTILRLKISLLAAAAIINKQWSVSRRIIKIGCNDAGINCLFLRVCTPNFHIYSYGMTSYHMTNTIYITWRLYTHLVALLTECLLSSVVERSGWIIPVTLKVESAESPESAPMQTQSRCMSAGLHVWPSLHFL